MIKQLEALKKTLNSPAVLKCLDQININTYTMLLLDDNSDITINDIVGISFYANNIIEEMNKILTENNRNSMWCLMACKRLAALLVSVCVIGMICCLSLASSPVTIPLIAIALILAIPTVSLLLRGYYLKYALKDLRENSGLDELGSCEYNANISDALLTEEDPINKEVLLPQDNGRRLSIITPKYIGLFRDMGHTREKIQLSNEASASFTL